MFHELRRAGIPQHILNSYMSRGTLEGDAVAWAKEEVDAAEVPVWTALGLHPKEAGRFARRGVSVAEVVRAWWEAAIPINEVADWLGAGLTPEEAAAQRAKGITAEQAATLRALRDDPLL